MQKTVGELADLIDADVVGDASVVIHGVNSIQKAKRGEIAFLANQKYVTLANETNASALITKSDLKLDGISQIVSKNPSLDFSKVIGVFANSEKHPLTGIHPTAVIHPNAQVDPSVALGAYVVVESDAVIGANTTIHSGTIVGQKVHIGTACCIYANVTLYSGISLGSNITIHSGTVIGSDGFGYEFVGGCHQKIPQVGTVVIEDDVEIGANVAIDRSRFDKTFIGRGTKIDNLVQIAHNVNIGEHCIIVSQVGLSGSVEIEDLAILAGQVGVAGHLTIGARSIIAAQSGVTKSIPPDTKVSGYPAKPHQDAIKVNAALQNLPRYVKTIKDLKQRIEELEKKING